MKGENITDINEYLENLFLFNGIDTQTLIDIFKRLNPEVSSFISKEIIYSPEEFHKKIGFILKGSCVVERINSDNKAIPLNKLYENDSFGIVAVLGQTDKFPTRIKALTKTEILFLSQQDVEYLIEKYPKIAKNIIYYLSGKIVFLNSKIATFASDTVEQKLANHILNKNEETQEAFIPFNCKKSAEALNIGRASLYRAITSFTEKKYIRLENKKIYIIDRLGLERILK